MNLPNTTGSFDPGFLASQGSGDAYKIVVHCGCSSAGTVNTLKKLGSNSSIESFFGSGPVVRTMKNDLAYLRLPQLGIRCTTSVAGACGSTRYAASATAAEGAIPAATGTVSFSGEALDDFELVWKFTLGGAFGVAKGRLSLDNGSTWLDEVTVSEATIVNALSGVTVTFDDTEGPFATSYWRCRTSQPETDIAGLTAALEALAYQMEERFGMVMVVQGFDTETLAEALAAADTAAALGPDQLNLYSVFLSFRRQDVTGEDGFGTDGAAETDEEYSDAAEALEYAGGLRVLKSFGEYRVQNTVFGLKPRRLQLEQKMLQFIKSRYDQELMEISLGVVPDVLTTYFSEEVGGSMYPRNWLVSRKWPGYVGEYMAGGVMATPPDSKMKYFYVRRIADQIEERLRRFAPHCYGKMAAASTGGGLTDEAATFWAGQFRQSAVKLIDGKTLLALTVSVSDSTTEDSTVQMVVGWDFTVALPIGMVTLQGSFSIGQ